MARVFRDTCRSEYERRGPFGVMGKWVEALPDFIVSLIDEHAEENFQMAKSNLIRGLALAGILGGVLWVVPSIMLMLRAPGVPGGAYRYSNDLVPLLLLGIGLGAVGLLCIYFQVGRNWPILSRASLLAAIAGGLWCAVSSFFTENFYLFISGYVLQMGGLALCGLSLLAQSAARRWAILFVAYAASMFIFNLEDWRAALGVAVGIIAILLSVLVSSLNRQNEPPVAMA